MAAGENFPLYANRPFRERSFSTLLFSQLAVGLNSAVFKDTAPWQNQSVQRYCCSFVTPFRLFFHLQHHWIYFEIKLSYKLSVDAFLCKLHVDLQCHFLYNTGTPYSLWFFKNEMPLRFRGKMFPIQAKLKKHIKADIWIYRNNKATVLSFYCKAKILTIIVQYTNINM